MASQGSNLDEIVETYTNDNGDWYRLYKSGWVVQGGFSQNTRTNIITINYLIPMKDNNYAVSGALFTGEGGAPITLGSAAVASYKTSTSLMLGMPYQNSGGKFWQIEGWSIYKSD